MIWVAGYCRVSTDKEDQMHSFAAQQRYFREYIERQPGCVLYEIYADEGITGTSTKKRVQFNRMMEDARKGRFQRILTKEVSRFSRNILDTITYTRELRALGIGIFFLNDGIYTMDADAELRLCIMGSIAQEESRRTSSRVKWGQTRQMERGVVFGHSLLGYDVQNGRITVNPEGAEIVRQIFYKYGMEKKSVAVIAKELEAAGFCTRTGSVIWNTGYIQKILQNEKYVGDLIQKKTYTPDFLTHEKKTNHGAEEKVCLANHHEPIVDRGLWETVQMERNRRNRRENTGAGHGIGYSFSGKIRCGECGATFAARKRTDRSGRAVRRWACLSAVRHGRRHTDENGGTVGCDVGWMLREEDAQYMVQTALKTLRIDRNTLLHTITTLTEEALQTAAQPFPVPLLRQYLEELLNGGQVSEILCRTLLRQMTVHKDKTVELSLVHIPTKWVFRMRDASARR
ncbi:MAG: recombinase family protein [Clostridia bacterium]|nr:recombinase family protein [Clostridia bacterium]